MGAMGLFYDARRKVVVKEEISYELSGDEN
jgi:hypothetical protein